MASRKFKFAALRAKIAEIQKLIDESDAAMEGEGAEDNPPPMPGTPAAPAEDSAQRLTKKEFTDFATAVAGSVSNYMRIR